MLWGGTPWNVHTSCCSQLLLAQVGEVDPAGGRPEAMSGNELKPSRRSAIRSFKVMDVVQRADQLARAGRTILHLEVGQPQSSAPQAAIKTAQEQVSSDRCGYTSARGEPPLRDALAAMYKSEYGVTVSPGSIHLTPGSSGGFTIVFMACFDVGDAVAVPASCYPCYRNLLECYGCEVVTLSVDERYNVTAAELAAGQAARAVARKAPIKGLILSSPANPTGAMLSPEELRGLCELCDSTGVQFISDEIYHGIVYSGAPRAACALEFTDNAIVINSFSKFYSMTGWRLGWLVSFDGVGETRAGASYARAKHARVYFVPVPAGTPPRQEVASCGVIQCNWHGGGGTCSHLGWPRLAAHNPSLRSPLRKAVVATAAQPLCRYSLL